ncbi:hypothetical protein GCM10028806_06330 [Spirosoma terrae]
MREMERAEPPHFPLLFNLLIPGASPEKLKRIIEQSHNKGDEANIDKKPGPFHNYCNKHLGDD